jgi:phosphinothricin acetyltransferase
MIRVRGAQPGDLEAITEIYNEAIETTTATFDTVAKSIEEQAEWFAAHGPKNPILVAERAGRVIGWAALSAWSDRCAYADTAEISIYVRESERGEGVGRRLIEAAVAAGREAGLHVILARITEGNAVSVHLHESVGFRTVGVMREVGRKFGRILDVTLMQLVYGD